MNGRIYDPLVGRFVSADILVSNPADLQSYNRYSYVRNNPLTLTDPSGFQESDAERRTREAKQKEEEEKRRRDEERRWNARNRLIENNIYNGGGLPVPGGATQASETTTNQANQAQPAATPSAQNVDTAAPKPASDTTVPSKSPAANGKSANGDPNSAEDPTAQGVFGAIFLTKNIQDSADGKTGDDAAIVDNNKRIISDVAIYIKNANKRLSWAGVKGRVIGPLYFGSVSQLTDLEKRYLTQQKVAIGVRQKVRGKRRGAAGIEAGHRSSGFYVRGSSGPAG